MVTTQTTTEIERQLCHPKGQLKACLLLLVEAKPSHGYELLEALNTFGYRRSEAPNIYRALRWLEASGLVRMSWELGRRGPARRRFSVTPKGRRAAEVGRATLLDRAEEFQRQFS